MDFLRAKLTWLRSIATIGILLTVPWALAVWEMMAGRASLAARRGLHVNTFAGYLGAVIASAAPIAAVGIGRLFYRRCSDRWRCVITICAALATTFGLACTGVYLITVAFPVQP